MNRGDQPVSIVFNVEDDKTVHIIRVWEGLAQLNEISPSGGFHNLDPGSDTGSSLTKLLRCLLQALDRDDMHCA